MHTKKVYWSRHYIVAHIIYREP